jgi:hypothetical protein
MDFYNRLVQKVMQMRLFVLYQNHLERKRLLSMLSRVTRLESVYDIRRKLDALK